ncbi:hypothetical protein EBR21_03875, partial [bacterium]|nr:hypothetical protein [bacterium]
KDFEKDKLANPGRPLPRGLISTKEMVRAIGGLFAILLLLSAAHLLLLAQLQGLLMAASVVYLWLMYKEFYIGAFLAGYPLLYALSHQIVGVPLYLYGVSLFASLFAGQELAWVYVGVNVCASISYEFTRKLKADAHPAALTYRQIYGLHKSAAIAAFFQALSIILAVSMYRSGISAVVPLLVVQGLALLLIVLQGMRDAHQKASEGFAALAVLFAAWVGVFTVFRF